MKWRFIIVLTFYAFVTNAQIMAPFMSRCGGADSVLIPSIIDNDNDGMDDYLEQKLLDFFTPKIIQFSGDGCPGPALNGTGDTNLIVCRIYPLPQQYLTTNKPDSIKNKPIPIVGKRGLYTGLYWHENLMMVNAAILYGKDCGLNGHTADVEGFSFSLKYIGADSVAGWRYDTTMANWMGGTLQTVSHAGTICEKVETKPYKSLLNPNGSDTVFASPSKHGNYLSVSGCNSSIICDPGCSGTQQLKKVKPINLGEPNAALVSDLGIYYAAYAGENPWGTAKFLASQGGNAGTIRDKMVKSLSSSFVSLKQIASNPEICGYYKVCFGTFGSETDAQICTGNTYNFRGKILSNQGIYYDTVATTNGCDSIIKLTLQIKPQLSTTLQETACANTGYFFKGNWLFNNGTYKDTLQSSFGCDSLIELQLSVFQPSFNRIQRSVCADSTFNFNGNLLTQSGTYFDTLKNANACDSVVQLDLQVANPLVTWNWNGDTLYSNGNNILLVGGSPLGGAYSGVGVNGNLFEPAISGNGVHKIFYTYRDTNGCESSVSKVVIVSGVSTIKELQQDDWQFYPNPSSGVFYVSCNQAAIQEIKIYDLDGKCVMEKKTLNMSNQLFLDVSAIPEGVYTIKISTTNSSSRKLFSVSR
jgi:hypothetical protein